MKGVRDTTRWKKQVFVHRRDPWRLSFQPGENLPIIRGSKILGISVRVGGGLSEVRSEKGNVNKSPGILHSTLSEQNIYYSPYMYLLAFQEQVQHRYSMVSQIWMNTSKWQACAGRGSEDAGAAGRDGGGSTPSPTFQS